MGRPARGTLAFLFSDLEGSTELLRTLWGNDYAHLIGVHGPLVGDACDADATSSDRNGCSSS
jgi:class 3 adenylate cyclase